METSQEAIAKLLKAWPHIVSETRQALGSELYYQAVVYHCLRVYAQVPIRQLGMNVKMRIMNPVSELFETLDARKNERFRGGFEPIPDVCLFSTRVGGDWRRRNREITLSSLLLAIEIKASERQDGRLRANEIISDIAKLAAHREEAVARGSSFVPVMMVIDVAPRPRERMRAESVRRSQAIANEMGVGFMYVSVDTALTTVRSEAALEGCSGHW
jgi:hypothetical protein